MDTETLDKLYLEYSQLTSARTGRELELEACIRGILAIKDLWLPSNCVHGHRNEYVALHSMHNDIKRLAGG